MPLLDRGRDDLAPGVLRVGDLLGEVGVGEQRGQLRVARVGGADPVEERGADDAAAAPDDRHLPRSISQLYSSLPAAIMFQPWA